MRYEALVLFLPIDTNNSRNSFEKKMNSNLGTKVSRKSRFNCSLVPQSYVISRIVPIKKSEIKLGSLCADFKTFDKNRPDLLDKI